MSDSSRRAAGWAVHLFTALGSAIAVFAMIAIARGNAREAFFWLAAAMAIDASDGSLARLVRVKEVVPEYNGAELDDIVDYLNFVVVPVFLMLQFGLLAGPAGYAAGVAALLASAYRFCHADAKTADHFFTGFPSYWNIIAFYLYVFDTGPLIGGWVIGILALLVFAPLRFVYPSRTVFLRPLTVVLGLLWSAICLWMLVDLPAPSPMLAAISVFYPIYYTALSFYLQVRTRETALP